jgi:predicted transcriptional regulator
MQTKVLLSIKPHYAEQIFSGSKRYEFRRVVFRSESVTKIVVYASSPVQRVIGEFRVDEILAFQKEELWRKTKRHGGINKQCFDSYFSGRDMAYAIRVSSPRRYANPVRISDLFSFTRPPQSFCYIR